MPIRYDLLKYAAAALFIALVALWCVFTTWCGYAKHINPKLYLESSAQDAERAAKLHAQKVGGFAHQNKCCGSMEPLIYAGDWIVTTIEPFTDNLLGKVVIYRRGNGDLLLHRLVSGNAASGFIASGDNNKRSEPDERVTASNYHQTAICIYRVDLVQ